MVDHFYTGAEYKDQEENGNISRCEQGLLEIAGSSRTGRARARRLWLKTTEKIMIEPGEAAVENKKGQDNEGIGEKFLVFEQFGNDEIGVDIIKGNQQQRVGNEKSGEVSLREKGEIFGSWEKDKRNQQETDPCCQMNDDLYNSLIQDG